MVSTCASGQLSSPRTCWKVKVCLVVFVGLSVLVDVLTSTLTSATEDLFIQTASNRFAQLSRSELLDVWHTDCHRRCRYQISSQVEIACQYDPYRAVHRKRRSLAQERPKNTTIDKVSANLVESKPSLRNETSVSPPTHHDASPFIAKDLATTFLRPRRASSSNPVPQSHHRSKREVNIMEECCFNKACAWEEYAEYCQRHPRRASERSSVCTYS